MELKAWQQVPFPTEPFRLPFFFLLESKARFSNTLGKCSTIEFVVCCCCLFFVLFVLRQDLAELPRVALTSQKGRELNTFSLLRTWNDDRYEALCLVDTASFKR